MLEDSIQLKNSFMIILPLEGGRGSGMKQKKLKNQMISWKVYFQDMKNGH